MPRVSCADSAAFGGSSVNLQFASGGGGSDNEDYELPMLEHTTALSDGYGSPRPVDLENFRQESLDVEAANTSFCGSQQDSELALGRSQLRSKAITRRCGWCTGLFTFILSHWSKAAVVAIIITLIVLVSVKGVSIFSEILNFFERWNSWGGWGIFIGMFILNVTLFLPSVALILGAGFIFGFWKGLLAVWAGGAVGQSLSFLLARYLVKDAVATYVAKKWSKWDLVEHVLAQEGWKMVLLLRLSPVVPWNLLNIAMASTNVSFFQFTVASAIGIGFESSVLCYFGSLAQNIRDIVSGDAKPAGKVVYILAGVSLLFCFLAATLATLSVRRALKRAHAFRQTQDTEIGMPPPDGAGGSETRGFLQQEGDGSGHDKLPASTSYDQLPRGMAAMLQTGSGFSSDDSGDDQDPPGSGSGFRSRVHVMPEDAIAAIRGQGSPAYSLRHGEVQAGSRAVASRQRALLPHDSGGWHSGDLLDHSFPVQSVGGCIELRSAPHASSKPTAEYNLHQYPVANGPDEIHPAGSTSANGDSSGGDERGMSPNFQDRNSLVSHHGIAT